MPNTAYELGVYTAKQASMGSGALVGAGLGGLIGLLNPDATEEYDEKTKKKIRKKHYLSSILSSGLAGGLTGAAIGGLLSNKTRANNPDTTPDAPTFTPYKPRPYQPDVSTSSASTSLDAPNPFPPNTQMNLSLRPYLRDIYGKAEGGLDKAIQLANDWRTRAANYGLITYKPGAIDKVTPVSSLVRDQERKNMDISTGGITNITPSGSKIVINTNAPHTDRTIRHELSHASFIPDNFKDLDERIRGASSVDKELSPRLQKYWKYVTDKSEFMAHLAEAKREYVKNKGKQVATEEDAMNVLDYFSKSPQFRNDVLSQLLPFALKQPSIKQQLLLQILSIVRGNQKPSALSYA